MLKTLCSSLIFAALFLCLSACPVVAHATFGDPIAITPLEIAKGEVPGHSFIAKFGENPVLGNGTQEAIWDKGGLYVPPTVARLHNVVSTDVDDDGSVLSDDTATGGSLTTLVDGDATFVSDGVEAGDQLLNDSAMTIATITGVAETTLTFLGGWGFPGDGKHGPPTVVGDDYRAVEPDGVATGASLVYIVGQNASRLEISEFVVLNGQTDVSTELLYVRQYTMVAFGGDTRGAEGTVTSTAATDGTVSAQIIDGNNRTMMAIFSVPIDEDGYILELWASMAGTTTADVRIELHAGSLDGIGYSLQPRSLPKTGNSDFDYRYPIPQFVPGGADIWLEAVAAAVNSSVSGGFTIIRVKKPN